MKDLTKLKESLALEKYLVWYSELTENQKEEIDQLALKIGD